MFARTVDRAFRSFQRTGRADALALVFDRTAPHLLQLARHLAARGVPAEDLLQATFLTAIEAKDRYDAAQPVVPWLVGILTNHARSARRRERRAPDAERLRLDDIVDADAEVQTQELAVELERAIDRLPELYRPVVRLHLQHGLDGQEIARSLERPHGTVRAQLHRGLERLRRLLPPGLGAAGAAATVSAQSLATVRALVVQRCGGPLGVAWSPAALLGATVMLFDKKVVAGLAALLALVASSALLLHERADAPAVASRDTVEPAAGGLAVHTPPAATEQPSPGAQRERVVPPEAPSAPPRAVATTGSLRVRVVGPDGSPLAEIGVTASNMVAYQSLGSSLDWVQTDAAGIAAFDDLAAETHVIQVDRADAREAVAVRAGRCTERTLQLHGITVVGTVVDAAGAPVAAATVFGHGVRAEALRLTIADAAGRFRLEHVSERLELQARARGHAPSRATVVHGKKGSKVSVQLTLAGPGCTVTGRVVEDAGKPVPGALVSLVPEAQKSLTPFDRDGPQIRALQVRTTVDGTFATDEAPAGELVVTAAGNAEELSPAGKVVTAGLTPVHVELQLRPGAVVEGRITDAGAPVADCTLFAFSEPTDQPTSYLFNLLGSRTGTTDSQGRFRLVGLVPGRVQVRALRGGFNAIATGSWTLQAGQRQEWNIDAAAAEPFVVRVSPPSSPATPGAWQVLAQRLGTDEASMLHADTSGVARFAGLRKGRYRFQVYCRTQQGDLIPAVVVEHDVRGGELSLVVPPERTRLQTMRGRLVDALQRPTAGRVLQARCLDETSTFAVRRTAGEDGTFTFDGLPLGRYHLELLGEGHATAPLREVTLAADRQEDVGDLTVPAAATRG